MTLLDPRAEIVAEYHAAKAANNQKLALDLLFRIGKLDKLSVRPSDPEPEPAPDSFPTQKAAVAYLVGSGWKANDSTFCLHVKQRKLVPDPDGTFSRSAVDSYALEHLVNNPERAEKNTSDDLILESKQLENRRLRMKVEQQEGSLVNSDDVKRELENMLVSFRSRVLIIPRKLSSQLAQMDSRDQVEELLTRELRDCLTTLAQYKGADTGVGAVREPPELDLVPARGER